MIRLRGSHRRTRTLASEGSEVVRERLHEPLSAPSACGRPPIDAKKKLPGLPYRLPPPYGEIRGLRFGFEGASRARIRAVYDHALPPNFKDLVQVPREPHPEEIKVVAPWIDYYARLANRSAQIAVVLCLVAAFSVGCRKEGPGQRPDRSDSTDAHAPDSLSVSGSSGPLRLTLSVPRQTWRAKENLWVRVDVTNIGARPIILFDQLALADPYLLGKDEPFQIRIELFTHSGERIKWIKVEDHPPSPECLTTLLRDLPGAKDVVIRPGTSVATPSQSFLSMSAQCRGAARKPPTPGFGEVAGFWLSPGKYKLRARFDGDSPSRDGAFEKRIPADEPVPTDVDVVTPFLELDVVE